MEIPHKEVDMQSLPDDIIIEIFEHMDTLDLLSSLSTCRRWNRIIAEYPKLWTHYMVIRDTDIFEADKKWKALKRLVKGRDMQSLFLEVTDGYYNDILWNETELCKYFPFESLLSLAYNGSWGYEVDIRVESVSKCKKLKILK